MPISAEDRDDFTKYLKSVGIKYRNGWQNMTGDVNNPNAINPLIQYNAQISLLYGKAIEINKRNQGKREPISVKAAAGGLRGCFVKDVHYSVSCSLELVAYADVVFNNVGNAYNSVQITRADMALYQATVGSNMRVFYMQKELHKKGMFRVGASYLRFATEAGLPATAGHGTGIGLLVGTEELATKLNNPTRGPGFAGSIISMNIVGPSGKERVLDEKHPNFVAIRGAHLGMFGAITQQRVQCRPDTKLQRTAEAINMHTFLKRMEAGCFAEHEMVSAICMPNYESNEFAEDGPLTVLHKHYDALPLNTKNKNMTAKWDKFSLQPEIRSSDAIHLQKIIGRFPRLVPTYMKLASKLEIINKQGVAIGPAYLLYHDLPEYPRASGLEDIDVLIPVSKENFGKEMRDINDRLNAEIKAFQDRGYFVITDAIYHRFFQGTRGGLSTSNVNPDTHWVYALDIVSDVSQPGWAEFKAKAIDILVNEFGGALHWGKTVFNNGKLPSRTYLKDRFPGLQDFLIALKQWHEEEGVPLDISPCLNDFDRRILKESENEEKEEKVADAKDVNIHIVGDGGSSEAVSFPLAGETTALKGQKSDPLAPMTVEEEAKQHTAISKQMLHLNRLFSKPIIAQESRKLHQELKEVQSTISSTAIQKAKAMTKQNESTDTSTEDTGCFFRLGQ